MLHSEKCIKLFLTLMLHTTPISGHDLVLNVWFPEVPEKDHLSVLIPGLISTDHRGCLSWIFQEAPAALLLWWEGQFRWSSPAKGYSGYLLTFFFSSPGVGLELTTPR